MLRAYVDYLVARGHVDSAAAEQAMHGAGQFREAIAGAAMRLNLLTADEIEQVLTACAAGEEFGRVAIERGYVSSGDMRLLQQLHAIEAALSVGGQLVMQGLISRDVLLQTMRDFFASVGAERAAVEGPGLEGEHSPP